MRALILLPAVLALAACADATGVPPAAAPGAANQPPSAAHVQLARAAGLNPPSAIAGAARAEGGTARDVALAGTLAVNPVGTSNLGGLGVGVLSILAAPPEPAEMWDKTIVRLSAGQSPAAFAAQMQAAIIKMGAGGERAGYAPIKLVGQTLYSRCGGGDGARPAPGCLNGVEVILTPVGKLRGDTIAIMRTEEYGTADFLSNNPLANVAQHEALSRAFPGKVYTYLAPRRTAKGWTPAGIYDAGRIYPL